MKINITHEPYGDYKKEIEVFFQDFIKTTWIGEPSRWQWPYLYMVFSDYMHYIENGITRFLEKDCLGGGVGVGKTHIMLYCLIAEMMFFGKIFSIQKKQYTAMYFSGSDDQLKSSVFEKLNLMLHTSKLNKYFEFKSRALVYRPYPNVRCNFKVCNRANPLSLKGCHPEGVMRVFLDELNAMPEEALHLTMSFYNSPDNIKRTQGTCGRITVASNPDMPGSQFHQIMDGVMGGWSTYQIAIPDACDDFSKNVYANAIREQEEDGEDSPMYKMYVLGEHVMSDNMSVHPEHVIRAALERPPAYNDPNYYIGVDPAGGVERDYSTYVVKTGDNFVEFFRTNTENVEQFAQRVFKKIKEYRPSYLGCDAGGVGLGFIPILIALVRDWNVQNRHDQLKTQIDSINNNGEPHDKKKYANRAAELAWSLRYFLQYRAHLGEYVPYAKEFISDLRIVKFRMNKDGQVDLVPKDKLPRSPDFADAGMYSMGDATIIDPQIHHYRKDITAHSWAHRRTLIC